MLNQEQTEKTPILSTIQLSSDNVNNMEENTGTKIEKEKEFFSFSKSTRYQKFTLVSMAFMEFCASTCFSLLAPFFPTEANKKGASDTLVGMIFGAFELVIFISAPIFGNYLTRIGSKFMFIAGVMVCGTCAILFGTLDRSPDGTPFIVMCFLSRSVEALGASAYITASFAIVAHAFPDHVSTVFGTLETFAGLGFMIGPPIGGALYEAGGYGLPFFVMGGTLITVACIGMKVMPSQDDKHNPFSGSVFTLMKSPLTWVTGISVVSGSVALGFLDPTLADHLSSFKLTTILIGLMFLIAPGVYALTASLWGRIGDRYGGVKIMMMVGNLLTAVAFVFMGPSPIIGSFIPKELWIIVMCLLCMGLFLGCALIPAFSAFLEGAKHVGMEDNFDTFGIVSGFFNSCFSLGAFLGPTVLGGVLKDKLGFGWAATGCAVFFLFSSSLIAIYCVCSKKYEGSVPSRRGYERIENEDSDDKINSQRSVCSEGFVKKNSTSYQRQVINSI
ncbi:hypothetical protein ScPMuIL_009109 [Solemya velum]